MTNVCQHILGISVKLHNYGCPELCLRIASLNQPDFNNGAQLLIHALTKEAVYLIRRVNYGMEESLHSAGNSKYDYLSMHYS